MGRLLVPQETLAGTEKALTITPGQASYYYRLALLSSDDQPAKAIEALKRAVTLNPADAHSWIDLGLQYEAGGDNARAGQCLLRAVAEDAEYLPKWTLANYYFRRNDPPQFWFWARQAAAMAYGDPLPLFRLCGQMEEDGKLIDRLAIRDASVRASYLAYLVGQNRIDLVGPASRRVLEGNRESDTPLLLAVCDRLLDQSRVGEALGIWNKLAETHRIPFGARSSTTRSPLTNGAFTIAPTSQGFDWRLPEVDGVSAASEESPGGLRLTFSGRQPERCEVLVQYVPVQENRKYKLSFLYRTSGIAAGTGLAWHITDGNGARNLGEERDLSAETATQDQISLGTPAGCRLVRLSLVYQRSLGTTRIAGFIVLRSIRMELANSSAQFPSEDPLRSRVMK